MGDVATLNPFTGDLQLINRATGDTGYTNLTEFVDQTAWRLFYSNADGDVTELVFGDSDKVLTSNGATSAPTWETPSGGAQTPWTANIEGAEYALGSVGDIDHDDATASDWNLINKDQDKDINLKINDGGTERTAIQIHGDSGIISHPRQSFVVAYIGARQTIANATNTTLNFDTEEVDVLGEFNTTTKTFTAIEAGVYNVTCTASWLNVNVNKTYFIQIRSSSAPTLARFSNTTVAQILLGQMNSINVKLAAGGTIYVQGYQNSGGNEIVEGGSSWESTLTITKVS